MAAVESVLMKRIAHYNLQLRIENDQLCEGAATTEDVIKRIWELIENEPTLMKAGVKIDYIQGPDGAPVNAPSTCDGCGATVEQGAASFVCDVCNHWFGFCCASKQPERCKECALTLR